jgi:hypothetical protein
MVKNLRTNALVGLGSACEHGVAMARGCVVKRDRELDLLVTGALSLVLAEVATKLLSLRWVRVR